MLSVLFITYNRSNLLKISYPSLREAISKTNLSVEYIVSDDCSEQGHFDVISKLGFDKITRATINAGLGANQNSGLLNCTHQYILQIQDDWLFTGDPLDLKLAIDILREDLTVGIVQLSPVCSDMPTEIRKTSSGYEYMVFKTDRAPWLRPCWKRPYADHPHIKSRAFISDLGPYLEGVKMSVTENDFKLRVANQGRWKVAQICKTNMFRDLGEACSLNPGGDHNKIVILIRKIPYGGVIENYLRGIYYGIEHLAARLTSIIFDY